MRPLRSHLWLIGLVVLCIMPAAGAQSLRAQSPPAAPADPQEHLRIILERPLYQRWRLRQDSEPLVTSELAAAIRDKLNQLGDWLDSVLRHRRIAPRGSFQPVGLNLGAGLMAFFWALAWLAIGAFVLAVIVLVVRLIRDRQAMAATGAVLSREQVAAALADGDALALGGDRWMDEAGRLFGERDFRAMYRALYLALLSGLHTRDKIDFNRHCTNWTYVRRYRGTSGEREVFSGLTELFDDVWYGLHPPSGADFATLRQQVRSLIEPGDAPG
jgi:hypothetical protein